MSSAGQADLTTPVFAPCPVSARYLQLPTLMMSLAQDYFMQTASRWLPSVANLKYYGNDAVDEYDQTRDGIEIFLLDDYRGDQHTLLRKIVIRGGTVGIRNPGIGGSQRMGTRSVATDGKLVAKTYFGTVVAFAMSREVGEARHIAAEYEQLFSHFSNRVRKEWNLQRFFVSQLGEPGRLKQFPGFFAVPIVCDYIYEDNIELPSSGFPIRAIVVDIS